MSEWGAILFGLFLVGWFIIGTGAILWKFMQWWDEAYAN